MNCNPDKENKHIPCMDTLSSCLLFQSFVIF
jgi:hypothetical protein